MPTSFDLIVKNGKCFINGQLKIVDIGKGFYNVNFQKDNDWSWKKFKSKHFNFDWSKPPSNWNTKESVNPSK